MCIWYSSRFVNTGFEILICVGEVDRFYTEKSSWQAIHLLIVEWYCVIHCWINSKTVNHFRIILMPNTCHKSLDVILGVTLGPYSIKQLCKLFICALTMIMCQVDYIKTPPQTVFAIAIWILIFNARRLLKSVSPSNWLQLKNKAFNENSTF